MNPFHYFMPTEIVFGPATLDGVGQRARALGARSFVVTGKNSARQNGSLDRVLAQLPQAVVYDAVEENPTSRSCEAAAMVCRDAGCDSIIALGGGSPLDAAKAIAVLARNPGRCTDYYGADRYANTPLPLIAIPTTSGTGSEVTPYSVLVDSEENTKRTIAGRDLFPVLAILDPELCLTMPRSVTVNTGLDALSQAMEGMVSVKATPLSDTLALEAIRCIHKALPRVADFPNDLEARGEMLYASMLTGCVIAQTGTTLGHGLGYYLTVEFGIPHGLANALVLTPVFQYDAAYVPEIIATIARVFGVHVDRESIPAVHAAIGNILHTFLHELRVSPAGRDAGMVAERLPWCAQHLRADASRFKNQVGTPTESELLQMFTQAYEGTLA